MGDPKDISITCRQKGYHNSVLDHTYMLEAPGSTLDLSGYKDLRHKKDALAEILAKVGKLLDLSRSNNQPGWRKKERESPEAEQTLLG